MSSAARLHRAREAVARAFDALTDPLMGWVTGRTHSRWGRRQVFREEDAVVDWLCDPSE